MNLGRALADFWRNLLGQRAGEDAALGRLGEKAAAKHLQSLGYRVMGTNVRVPFGEADIVCEGPDGASVVIVEVKTRRVRAGRAIAPDASVTRRKRATLQRIAKYLMKERGWSGRPVRIEVIAVEVDGGDSISIRHYTR